MILQLEKLFFLGLKEQQYLLQGFWILEAKSKVSLLQKAGPNTGPEPLGISDFFLCLSLPSCPFK